ncbi:uncharacterized protein [Dysidea avara]|uniref:uncharacterized protein n=1 Tax=Dysidea avara TaxID=196820 RepID=UPI0033249CA2
MGCSTSLSKHNEATVKTAPFTVAPKERAKVDHPESIEHLSWCSHTGNPAGNFTGNAEHVIEHGSDRDSTSSTSSVYGERLAPVESGAHLSWYSAPDLKSPQQEINQKPAQLPDKPQKRYYPRSSCESVDHLSWCSIESVTNPAEVRVEVSSGSDLSQPQTSVKRPVGRIREDVIALLNKLARFVGFDEFEEALKSLHDIYKDVVLHPNDDKHRQMTFSSKVWRYPACEELMKMSGWVMEDDHVRLKDNSNVHIVFQQLESFSQLLSASRNGHTKTMAESLNDYNKFGLDLPYVPILLFAAISGDRLSVVNTLVKQYGADLNCLTSDGEACIFYAIDNATESFTIKLLTDYSIDTTVTTDDGDSCLHKAVKNGYTELVDFLIEKFHSNVHTINDKGATPLDYSFQFDHTEVTQLLLQHGAAPKPTTNKKVKCLQTVPNLNELNIYVDKMATTYYEIGLQLGVPNERLKMIRKDYATEAERCREMLDVWINDDLASSWLKLINTLGEIHHNKLAQQMLRQRSCTV